MPPAPLAASILTGLLGTLGLIDLALDPSPYSASRALLVASGMGVATLVVVAGVLVARGRWSRWALMLTAASWIAIAARNELGVLSVTTLVVAASVLTLSAGPWLARWLRHRPTADGPPPSAVVLLLSLLWLPMALGVAPGTAGGFVWFAAVWSLALAAAISRASVVALWAGRLAHPVIMIVTATVAGLPEAGWIGAVGAAQTGLLWRRDLHLSVSPLVPPAATAVPIPPELVSPEILRAAGRDERGHRLEST